MITIQITQPLILQEHGCGENGTHSPPNISWHGEVTNKSTLCRVPFCTFPTAKVQIAQTASSKYAYKKRQLRTGLLFATAAIDITLIASLNHRSLRYRTQIKPYKLEGQFCYSLPRTATRALSERITIRQSQSQLVRAFKFCVMSLITGQCPIKY
jgi:hypothetical protein